RDLAHGTDLLVGRRRLAKRARGTDDQLLGDLAHGRRLERLFGRREVLTGMLVAEVEFAVLPLLDDIGDVKRGGLCAFLAFHGAPPPARSTPPTSPSTSASVPSRVPDRIGQTTSAPFGSVAVNSRWSVISLRILILTPGVSSNRGAGAGAAPAWRAP